MDERTGVYIVPMVGGEPGWVLLRNTQGHSWPVEVAEYLKDGLLPPIEELLTMDDFVAKVLRTSKQAPIGPSA